MVQIAASLTYLLALAASTSALAVRAPIEARSVSCEDNLGPSALANVNEAVECINFLASLGGQGCVAKVSGQSFCRRGNTQITGLIPTGGPDTVTCQQVAQAAGSVLDRCTRGDGTVRGQADLGFLGNAGYLVDIRNVPE